MILIKNGKIYTMEDDQIINGDILIDDGKIIEIGNNLVANHAEVIDATDKYVYPGFVEAHCHLGLDESSIRIEGKDYNETSNPITPHMRGKDGINPMDETIINAKNAGVTTVCARPGSANVLGGTFVVYKTHGTCIDNMILKDDAAMKCAFGENPKMLYQNGPLKTRMNIVGLLRETLFKTKEYLAKKEAANQDISKMPAFDMKLEAMIPVIKKEIPLKAHAHRADDILTSIRVAKEFDLDMTLDHCTEGHLIVDEVKNSGFNAIVGPSLTHKSKFELKEKSFTTPAVLQQAGILIAITSDSPVVPQEYLPLCVSLAVKSGLDAYEGIKAITINAAKIIGVADRVGSIKEGKDGDIVIVNGDILDVASEVEYTIINGEIVYKK